jgi:hypothetical protein
MSDVFIGFLLIIAVIYHGGDYEDYDLVKYDVLWLCTEVPTFGMSLLPPYSG